MHDNTSGTLFNNVRKHGERRRQASIPIREDVDVSTFDPSLVDRGVDGFLNVFTVKVDRGLCGLTVKTVSSTSWAPKRITRSYGKPKTSHKSGYYRGNC